MEVRAGIRKIKRIFSLGPMGRIYTMALQARFKRMWRKRNKHNFTSAESLFDMDAVEVGKFTYGDIHIVSFNHKSRLRIGSFVSIAQQVHFLLDAEHYLHHLSTYPFRAKILGKGEAEAFSKGDIVVGDDVWIGYGACILSGVTIGQGAVVAAGALVVKDIPAYGVAGGVPAKVIRYRFEPDIVEELCRIDYSSLTVEQIREHMEVLYEDIDQAEQIRRMKWLPRK